ncbi:MAG: sigma-70 family RNA polymerase sigma factor [Bryobacteraceae bacterium]
MTNLGALHDTDLIERTLAGQSECFAVLMNRHTTVVRKRVRAMIRNSSDEDDLVQETFLKAWRHLASYRSDASFRTWITRVATNEVLQHFRRDRRHPAGADDVDFATFASGADSPQDALLRAEARRTIRKALETLPEKYRLALVLHDLQELSTQEAAEWLHFGIPRFKTRLFRARQMLTTAVRRHHVA